MPRMVVAEPELMLGDIHPASGSNAQDPEVVGLLVRAESAIRGKRLDGLVLSCG
jgi:hypothetical protein